MARPWATIGIGVGVFALSAVAFQFIGSEFIPRLDERNLATSALRIPSTTIAQSLDMQRKVERVISSFPQVQYVISKTRTAEVASAPMPPNHSDGFVIINPQEEWHDLDLHQKVLLEPMSDKFRTQVANS